MKKPPENRQFIIDKVARDRRRPRASPGTATPTAASSSTTPARFVDGDFLTAILAEHLLAKQPRRAAILYDVRASRAVADTVARAGGAAHANRVGHAFFKTRMRDEGAIFGGEVSGHYYFHDFYNADSGTIPALLILEKLSVEGKRLSELLEPYRSTLLHLRRDQLRGRRRRRRRWPRSRSATPTREISHLDGVSRRLRRLALQRAPVEHRAAAAPVPGVARLRRGHGAPPARRGTRRSDRRAYGCLYVAREAPGARAVAEALSPFRGPRRARPRRCSSAPAGRCRSSRSTLREPRRPARPRRAGDAAPPRACAPSGVADPRARDAPSATRCALVREPPPRDRPALVVDHRGVVDQPHDLRSRAAAAAACTLGRAAGRRARGRARPPPPSSGLA